MLDLMSGLDHAMGSTNTKLKFSAVFACNDRISKDIASLPFRPLERTEKGQQVAYKHDQFFVSKSPSPLYRKFMYFYTLNSHTNLYGNGYSPITRVDGRPVSYGLWMPNQVKCFKENNRLYWVNTTLKDRKGDYLIASDHDMIHTMWFTQDGINGMTPLTFARESINLGLSATSMMTENYENAIRSPYYLSLKEIMTPDQREILENSLAEMGGPGNGDLEVFDNGGEFKAYPFATKDIETLNSREISVRDVCRFMGVPGSKIGLREANVSYNSLEQENIAYVQDTILPRCIHIEEEFDAKALAEDSEDDIRFKFELKSRLRGDMDARSKFYSAGIKDLWMTINDVRGLEDMDTIGPLGDMRFCNAATVTLEDVAAGKTIPGQPAPQKLFETFPKPNGKHNGKADEILQHPS